MHCALPGWSCLGAPIAGPCLLAGAMETLVCQQPCSAPVLTRKQSQHFKSVRLAAAREDLVCQQPWLLHTAMMATNSTESALPGPCIAHCLYKRVFCPDLCVPVAAVHLLRCLPVHCAHLLMGLCKGDSWSAHRGGALSSAGAPTALGIVLPALMCGCLIALFKAYDSA